MYKQLTELINDINEPNQHACKLFLTAEAGRLRYAKGSSVNHQAWEGGYVNHITETMNIAHVLYDALNSRRALPFSRSDALLVLFLHDVEKPWRHNREEFKDPTVTKTNVMPFREKITAHYGFVLTPEHWNGIKYAEGEVHDYTPGKRTQGPLAAFVHLCDNTSARIWYDHPTEKGDEWVGARRVN